MPLSRDSRILLATVGTLVLLAEFGAGLRAQGVPASPFGITPLLGPVYGPPQATVSNPYITWRAFSGISSFTHPENGHDYAVGCASDGILIVDVTPDSHVGGSSAGPAVASSVNGNWWWIPETGWSVTQVPDPRTTGTYPLVSSNPLGNLMTTDTRNREAVAFVQNNTVYLYSTNHFRPGIWVIELPAPSTWPASGSILVPASNAWAFEPTGNGTPGLYPGVVGERDLLQGIVHQKGGGHTISIDKAHRQIYVCGNNAEVPDWSLPTPTGRFLGTMTVYDIDGNDARTLHYVDTLRLTTQQTFGPWTVPAATHDVQIFGIWCVVSVTDAAPDGQLGVQTIPAPVWALIDISNGWQGSAGAQLFSSNVAPHSAWFDGRFLWGINEINQLSNIIIYDTLLPSLPPRVVANLTTPQAPSGQPAIVHHIRGIGHTGFVAHYQDGLQVIDLSAGGAGVPLEQQVLANLDTSSLSFPPNPTLNPFENWFQGIWDVAVDFDSGIVCATQVGSPLGEPAGLLVLRYDIGAVNRSWDASPFPAGAPWQGAFPRVGLPEGPPRQGRNLLLIDENWSSYPAALGICYFTLQQPSSPAADPLGFWWNLNPASVQWQAVLVNPNVDATGQYYGHCVLAIPAGLTAPIYCQIVVQDTAGRYAASRGTWYGVGG